MEVVASLENDPILSACQYGKLDTLNSKIRPLQQILEIDGKKSEEEQEEEEEEQEEEQEEQEQEDPIIIEEDSFYQSKYREQRAVRRDNSALLPFPFVRYSPTTRNPYFASHCIFGPFLFCVNGISPHVVKGNLPIRYK